MIGGDFIDGCTIFNNIVSLGYIYSPSVMVLRFAFRWPV